MGGMRQAGGTGRLGRLLSIVALAILLLLVGSAAHTITSIATEPSIEERARQEAVRQAAVIGDALVHGVGDSAAELGQTATRNGRVEVLSVDGTDRRRSPGVRMVFRVHVAMSRPAMAGRKQAEVRICFRQVVDQERADFSRIEVPCPDSLLPGMTPTAAPTHPAGHPAPTPGTNPADAPSPAAGSGG
ncbi:hypothetical protein GCM10022225_31780 [Plantactinospora mayteni]|uniref:Uncharacterized protein n=1 Tax=Plantactinospora mayteni TaxID=566021 RepID=A0ABQ4ELP8_9ACTN|nr:hypothetical protein [Plantactinospora mayteni]GIG95658.1 hypothetical protein Pma05_22310 [Plantactinospora mayteni]